MEMGKGSLLGLTVVGCSIDSFSLFFCTELAAASPALPSARAGRLSSKAAITARGNRGVFMGNLQSVNIKPVCVRQTAAY